MSEGDLTWTSAISGLAMKTVAAGALNRISVPLLTSSTIGAPLALTWLAPPPRKGLGAFCGAAATAPRASVCGDAVCAAVGVDAKAAKMIDPARPTSGGERIKDLETRVETWLTLA